MNTEGSIKEFQASLIVDEPIELREGRTLRAYDEE